MSIGAKIFEMFRNLKSDAVPKAPRPQQDKKKWDKIKIEDVTDEDLGEEETYNCSYEEPEDGDADTNYTKDKQKNKNKSKQKDSKHKENRNQVGNHVNTHAGGNVINIVDCVDLHWGNVIVNNFGSDQKQKKNESDEPKIKKTPEITLLLAAKIKLEHEYMSYISQNLGLEWHRFFRRLGYKQGQIETFEYDEMKNGVAEVRYKILLDWVRNEEDASLGRLATELWADGWRDVVQGLAAMYHKNRKC